MCGGEKKHMLHAHTVLDLAHHGHLPIPLNTKLNIRHSTDTIHVGRTLRTYAACCKVQKLTPALNKQIVSSYYTVCARQCAPPGSASMIHVSLMCFACNCWSAGGTEGVRSRVRCCILQILATDERHQFSWTRVIKG